MCHHRSSGLWMQLLNWGEGRPTPKPSTVDFCPLIPGSNCKRECSTLLPAARNSIMQQPQKTLFKALQEAQEDGNGDSDDD
mmetsp:Transcript_9291/g.13948  ORF Transcript_9291/g.13948 Transcript_9291/m.13948 type:complete len:81 (+) Transcript_9291:1975-2217(+)